MGGALCRAAADAGGCFAGALCALLACGLLGLKSALNIIAELWFRFLSAGIVEKAKELGLREVEEKERTRMSAVRVCVGVWGGAAGSWLGLGCTCATRSPLN